jgi:hypothetical protein
MVMMLCADVAAEGELFKANEFKVVAWELERSL